MPVDVRPAVTVRRSPGEVAAYMFDPAHDMEWTGGITASHPDQPGRLHVGSAVTREARFLGRRFRYRYVVTSAAGDHLEMTVDRPFPMTIRYELEPTADGTRVAIHAVGDPGRFFGWATPLMRRQVQRSIRADLERLRHRLEPPGG